MKVPPIKEDVAVVLLWPEKLPAERVEAAYRLLVRLVADQILDEAAACEPIAEHVEPVAAAA